MSKTLKRLFSLEILAATAVWLTGCASPPPPAPQPKRDDFYIEKETYRPRKPKPPPEVPPPKPAPPATPASASAVEAAPAVAQPTPPAQLPVAAQSPTTVAPAGGLPHDASQYIEPPSR